MSEVQTSLRTYEGLSLQPDLIIPVGDGDRATLIPRGVAHLFGGSAVPRGRRRHEFYWTKIGTWQKVERLVPWGHRRTLFAGEATR